MASGILPLNQFILNYDRKLQINDDVLEKAKPEVESSFNFANKLYW